MNHGAIVAVINGEGLGGKLAWMRESKDWCSRTSLENDIHFELPSHVHFGLEIVRMLRHSV